MPQPSKPQKRIKPSSTLRSTLFLESPSSSGPPPAKRQKTKTLSSLARLPVSDLTWSEPDSSQEAKATTTTGKEKVRQKVGSADSEQQLWVDRYEPMTEDDLAVNKRKVQDVRQWLFEAFEGGPSGKLKKYRRILVLRGPAGTGKTTTLRMLSRELGFEILEWQNAMGERFINFDELDGNEGRDEYEYEGLSDKFKNFLVRASCCRSVFVAPEQAALSSQSQLRSQSRSSTSTSRSQVSSSGSSQPTSAEASTPGRTKRQIILLEDLPNVLHSGTQAAFHAALEAFVTLPEVAVVPLVIIVSDTGLRGEDSEADGVGGGGWRRAKEVLDVRSVLSPGLLSSPFVTQISFRPIAPSYMRPALESLLMRHVSASGGSQPTKDVLSLIVESSNGDIRSAIMALQFACTSGTASGKPLTRGGLDARVVMEAVTRREQSLALFHLLGKLLYSKRKDDPPNLNASAKDVKRDRELDATLKSQPPLPVHLQEHERRTSRVDVEMLYADSPIDASLLSLYIHQNYTQYCNELPECEALVEWLSWIDASGGESWHQTNPHQFHLLALSTLHSLPSPVQRRNQKSYKPAFFESLQKEREAEDGVRDVQAWLLNNAAVGAGGWRRQSVALEVGGVLKARDLAGHAANAPSTHRLFSKLEFTGGNGDLVQLSEEGNDAPEDVLDEDEDGRPRGADAGAGNEPAGGGWQENDDIEDF